MQDLIEKQKTEDQLRKANYELKTLFENMRECFFTVDATIYHLVQISPSCQEIYGYSVEEFMQNDNLWIEVVLEEDREAIWVKNADLDRGETIVNIYRILDKRGNIKWLESTIIPTLDQSGKLVRLDGVTSDITQRTEAEMALKKSLDDLKKTNAELDRFVYSVSHDLRAPLSSMMGIISLIESENVNTNVSGDISLLKKSINKLDGFINDILDYSRNSRMEISPQQIDFRDLLDEITNDLKYMATANSNTALRININSGQPFYSDKTRLSIILNNLISNSIRYSDPGNTEPFVEINIDVTQQGAIIIVRDNGIGIAAENLDKIFDMFYRVSKRSVGSGLGLYIVKETIAKLKGQIEVISQAGQGTQFTITLPGHQKNIK